MSKWSKRVWLNDRKDLTAFIIASTEYFQDDRYVTGDLKIGDCNRMITLDFNSTGSKERVESIAKLNRLRGILDEFQERLTKYHEKADK